MPRLYGPAVCASFLSFLQLKDHEFGKGERDNFPAWPSDALITTGSIYCVYDLFALANISAVGMTGSFQLRGKNSNLRRLQDLHS